MINELVLSSIKGIQIEFWAGARAHAISGNNKLKCIQSENAKSWLKWDLVNLFNVDKEMKRDWKLLAAFMMDFSFAWDLFCVGSWTTKAGIFFVIVEGEKRILPRLHLTLRKVLYVNVKDQRVITQLYTHPATHKTRKKAGNLSLEQKATRLIATFLTSSSLKRRRQVFFRHDNAEKLPLNV